MSITLHHLRASRSARIFWVLEELGLKYDVEVHDFGSPEWDKLSPFGKVSRLVLGAVCVRAAVFNGLPSEGITVSPCISASECPLISGKTSR